MMIRPALLGFFIFIGTACAVSTGQIIESTSMAFAQLIYLIPAVIIATGLRGAFIARKVIVLGDHYGQKTPTWNPIQYLDPMGSLAGIFFFFGWPRTADFDRRLFHNPLRDEVRLYLSASGFNLLFALLSLIAMLLLPHARGFLPDFALSNIEWVLQMMALVNLMVGIYSFLPLFPLPGYDLLFRFLSPYNRIKLDQKRSITMLVLMLLLFIGRPILVAPVESLFQVLVSMRLITLGVLSLLLAHWLFLIQLRKTKKDKKS